MTWRETPEYFNAYTSADGVGKGPGYPARSFGIQRPYSQAGGPSGDPIGPARGAKPWPYITRFFNPFQTFPYGTASTNAAIYPWPYMTVAPAFRGPIGMQKKQTGPTYFF